MAKDKHAPMEVSSKHPVSVIRQPPCLEAIPKMKHHDPRFDRAMGHYNPDMFQKSYSFIDDLQSKELKMVKDELLNKRTSEERRADLSRLLDRAKTKQKQRQKDERRKTLVKEWRDTEKELVKSGKKQPFYLKKSDIRKLELIDDYKRTKQANPNLDVDKLVEKKRKRKASKQRRNLPIKQ
jgi:ribosomal RNA-processing protein 36